MYEQRRIALASQAFGRLRKSIWNERHIRRTLKIRMYKALILPIAIYACETWTLKKEDERKLEVFEMRCLRAIYGTSLRDRIPNAQIRRSLHMETSISEIIKQRRLSWFGHVVRRPPDHYLSRAYRQDFFNSRPRGRPAKRWRDQIRHDTGLPIETMERRAQDRTLESLEQTGGSEGRSTPMHLSQDDAGQNVVTSQQPPTALGIGKVFICDGAEDSRGCIVYSKNDNLVDLEHGIVYQCSPNEERKLMELEFDWVAYLLKIEDRLSRLKVVYNGQLDIVGKQFPRKVKFLTEDNILTTTEAMGCLGGQIFLEILKKLVTVDRIFDMDLVPSWVRHREADVFSLTGFKPGDPVKAKNVDTDGKLLTFLTPPWRKDRYVVAEMNKECDRSNPPDFIPFIDYFGKPEKRIAVFSMADKTDYNNFEFDDSIEAATKSVSMLYFGVPKVAEEATKPSTEDDETNYFDDNRDDNHQDNKMYKNNKMY